MKKILLVLVITSMFSFSFGICAPAIAGDVDVLIKKLVEKGILSESDAKDIVKEIQKEGVAEEERVKEVAAETAKEVAENEIKEGGLKFPELPAWVKKIKPFGDLRLRHDTQWKDKDSGSDTRNRERFRLRFGVKSQVTENTEVGIRMASGSGFQNTTNQSFDDHGRGKNIFIDRAYAKWDPCQHFTLQGGKHKNPLFTTPLVWDPDVNPEGVAEAFNINLNDNAKLYANLGQWFIQEIKTENSDPTLLAFQLGSKINAGKKVNLEFAATYYEYLNMDRIQYSDGDIDDKETFIGYNNEYGQQMIFDDEGDLVNEWGCLEIGAKAKFKDVLPLPFSIFGDFIVNFDADIDELTSKGVAYTDTDPADLLAYGSDDRDMGWLVGFDLGNKKKKGDWYFKYHYQVLEDYAFPAVFVDSDFHGGGTNNKGHYIQGRYYLMDKIQARATGFLTERDDESKDGKFDEDRIQLDIVIEFP
jgi:polyhydroxyalkanoate synthesis regulator phasin